MQLAEAARMFLADKGVYCGERTVGNYAEHLQRFRRSFPGDPDVTELSGDDIKQYITALRGQGTRNVTVRTYLRSIRVFCSWLHGNGHTDTDLFAGVKLPRPDAALKYPLTAEEAERIDAACDARDRAIVHLMLDAGLRASEVCSLTFCDVDFTNRLIRVRNSKYNKSRAVPLAPKLEGYIRQLPYAGGYVAPSRRGEQLTVNAIKQLFARLKRQSGVSRVHAHLLRHTFATSYIVGGGNLEKLRIMLGHGDYNVTQSYLHLAAQFEVVHYPIYQLDAVFFKSGYGPAGG